MVPAVRRRRPGRARALSLALDGPDRGGDRRARPGCRRGGRGRPQPALHDPADGHPDRRPGTDAHRRPPRPRRRSRPRRRQRPRRRSRKRPRNCRRSRPHRPRSRRPRPRPRPRPSGSNGESQGSAETAPKAPVRKAPGRTPTSPRRCCSTPTPPPPTTPTTFPPASSATPASRSTAITTTSWTAQVNPATAPSMAEGVLINLKSLKKLSALELVSSSKGMVVQIYGTAETRPRPRSPTRVGSR